MLSKTSTMSKQRMFTDLCGGQLSTPSISEFRDSVNTIGRFYVSSRDVPDFIDHLTAEDIVPEDFVTVGADKPQLPWRVEFTCINGTNLNMGKHTPLTSDTLQAVTAQRMKAILFEFLNLMGDYNTGLTTALLNSSTVTGIHIEIVQSTRFKGNLKTEAKVKCILEKNPA